jgi:hypothetical protein
MNKYDFSIYSVRFSITGVDVWLHVLKLNKTEVTPQYCFMDLPPFYLEEDNPFYNPPEKETVYKFKHPLMSNFDKIPDITKLNQLYFRGSVEKAEKELIKRYETYQALPVLEKIFKNE